MGRHYSEYWAPPTNNRQRAIRSDYDPLNRYIRRIWNNIKLHTVNSDTFRINRQSRSYAKKGIELRMKYEEFAVWCRLQRGRLMVLKRPSIDRIDSNDHYKLGNLRFIELADNCRQGTRNKQSANEVAAAKLNKQCSYCAKPLIRKQRPKRLEQWTEFKKRKYCNHSCKMLHRYQKLRGC